MPAECWPERRFPRFLAPLVPVSWKHLHPWAEQAECQTKWCLRNPDAMIAPMSATPERDSFPGIDEDAALRSILEVTAPETGARFFETLVRSVARALGTQGAWVTEYIPEGRRLRALAFWLNGKFMEWERPIDGTPCEQVIQEERLVHITDGALSLYPDAAELRALNVCSYLGVPLKDAGGAILGHLAVIDPRPLPRDERALSLFRIFAD